MTTPSLSDGWQKPSADSLSTLTRDFSSLAALIIVAGTVVVTDSAQALVLALPFLVAALPTPSPIAYAAGQLAVLPTITVEDTAMVAIVQLALLVVLVEPARTGKNLYAIGATLVAYVGLVTLVVVSLPPGVFVAGGLLCLAAACGTYLARRVTLVRLGLVTDNRESESNHSVDRSSTEPKE